MNTWKCDVCGYVHQGTELPARCPICDAERDHFSPLTVTVGQPTEIRTTHWRCSICDHQAKGAAPPPRCEICGAAAQLFEAVHQEPVLCGDSGVGRIIIVGSGIAALTAAEEARKCNTRAEITLIGKEPGLPYYRLNLTRLLAGEVTEESLTIQAQSWFAEQNIQLIQGEVTQIDRSLKQVHLRDERSIPYDRLILANGSHPFIPPFPGVTRDGVQSLRTLADAQKILAKLGTGQHCVCIGGGLLGLETAAAIKRRGARVTVLEGHPWLMPRQLPEQAGRLLQQHLEAMDIRVICGVQIQELAGDDRLRSVVLSDGREFPAELAIISTGVRPNSFLARQADLKVKTGVLVDDHMATSDEHIYAAGDVAEHRGQLYGIWPASYAQGLVAGLNAAGGSAEFPGLSLATRIKVVDVDLFSVGQLSLNDASYRLVEKIAEGSYSGLVCRDNHLVGAALYGNTELAGLLKDAIENEVQLPELPELLETFPELLS